jgi:hypothetical protein
LANRIALAIVATIALISSSFSVTGAQAVSETLTYEELAATENHQELVLAMENFTETMLSGKKMNLTSTVKSKLGATSVGLIKITATTSGNNFKSRQSIMNLMSPSSSSGDTTVIDFGLKNGVYFGTIASVANRYNLKSSTLKRLGKPKATHYTTRNKSLLQYIQPTDSEAVIYSNSLAMATWNLFGNVTDNPEARYSVVEKIPNVKNPNNTDYIFDVKVPGTMSTDDFNEIHTVVTISGDGKSYSVKSEAKVPYFSVGIMTSTATTSITLTPTTIALPDPKSAVNLQSLVDLSYIELIEEYLTTMANAVVKQANTIASRARKSLSISHLITAAKAMTYKYTVTKGVMKLTQKYMAISVSACISISNKKAVVKIC